MIKEQFKQAQAFLRKFKYDGKKVKLSEDNYADEDGFLAMANFTDEEGHGSLGIAYDVKKGWIARYSWNNGTGLEEAPSKDFEQVKVRLISIAKPRY